MNKSGPLSLPFIKLYAITFLFFSANPIINVIVPLRSEAQGASNAAIGVMMGAYMITSMLFRPWARLATGIIGFTAPLPSGSQAGHQDEEERVRAFLICSTAMLVASVSFGAVTTFIALYTKQSGVGSCRRLLDASSWRDGCMQIRFAQKVPSDGQWHPRFLTGLLLSMAVGLNLLALAVFGGALLMYAGSMLIGLGMALLYPQMVTYLTIVAASGLSEYISRSVYCCIRSWFCAWQYRHGDGC